MSQHDEGKGGAVVCAMCGHSLREHSRKRCEFSFHSGVEGFDNCTCAGFVHATPPAPAPAQGHVEGVSALWQHSEMGRTCVCPNSPGMGYSWVKDLPACLQPAGPDFKPISDAEIDALLGEGKRNAGYLATLPGHFVGGAPSPAPAPTKCDLVLEARWTDGSTQKIPLNIEISEPTAPTYEQGVEDMRKAAVAIGGEVVLSERVEVDRKIEPILYEMLSKLALAVENAIRALQVKGGE